jgi:hypothetical protein
MIEGILWVIPDLAVRGFLGVESSEKLVELLGRGRKPAIIFNSSRAA